MTKQVAYGRTPQGQLFYDLAFTDLSEPWLARKHKMPRAEINRLRLLAREIAEAVQEAIAAEFDISRPYASGLARGIFR